METPDITIRRAVPADWETIAEYNVRLAAETEDMLLNRDTLEAGVKALLADDTKGFYCVAEANGDIIGQAMITYEWSDWRNGPIWWFQSVYVHADWRRHGIFRRLYAYIVKLGQKAGVVEYRLYAVKENAPALATYQSLGMKFTPYIVMEYCPEETN